MSTSLKLTVPTLKFRARLSKYLQMAAFRGATITVTRCGQAMAVLTPPPVTPLGEPDVDTLAQADRLAAEGAASANSKANSSKNPRKPAAKRHAPACAPSGKRPKS